MLDLVTDPQGNQVHVAYQRDVMTAPGGWGYPRDQVPESVEWDSPGCQNAQVECTGAAWQPQMRVLLGASHSVEHAAGPTCAASWNLRCDDPVDLSGSGGLGVPEVQSTYILNDIAVQVRAGGSAAWNTLRDYR